MTKKAVFTVKRRQKPMLAVVAVYNEESGRTGKVLASEPIRNNFSNADLIEAAKRLVPKAEGYEVVLPIGVDI